jgi:hypothetical protein
MFHHELVVADACAFFDRALDDVAGDAGPARFIEHRGQARVPCRLGAAQFGGDHDFLDEFPDDLTFLQPGDLPLGVQPLATHTLDVSVAARLSKRSASR